MHLLDKPVLFTLLVFMHSITVCSCVLVLVIDVFIKMAL